jgi:hypothetical protein
MTKIQRITSLRSGRGSPRPRSESDGKIDWNNLVLERLPDFQYRDKAIREKSTLDQTLELLEWNGNEDGNLDRREQPSSGQTGRFHETTTYLEPICPLGSKYMSNNWCCGIISQTLEQASHNLPVSSEKTVSLSH